MSGRPAGCLSAVSVRPSVPLFSLARSRAQTAVVSKSLTGTAAASGDIIRERDETNAAPGGSGSFTPWEEGRKGTLGD